MPIEFQCTRCNLRLRTPDDTAGKQAQCPSCRTLVPIPSPGDAIGGPADGGDIPSGQMEPAATPAPNPFADPPLVNPYQTGAGPFRSPMPSRGELRGKLVGPAVGMIVGAALSIVYSISNLIFVLVTGPGEFGNALPNDPALNAAIVGVVHIFTLPVPVLVIIGAIAMLRMKSYSMAKAGSILAMMPCQCCCAISLPFGIWGLMVLGDVDVRDAFQSSDHTDSTFTAH